eukprot:SAG22_NODE_9340_length_594_cov_1.347475_2_plen_83_part_00
MQRGASDGAKEMDRAYERFLALDEIDGTLNPDVAYAQKELLRQGWGQFCVEILSKQHLRRVHRSALRADAIGNRPPLQRRTA